jgi:hypothetical protein
MAAIQATTATTLNPSPDRKEAAGKNIKWNRTLPGPRLRRSEGAQYSWKINMFLSSFDILRKARGGKPVLLAVAGDLGTACLRLRQLASLMPGEYFVFDPRTQQIVAAMDDSEWQVTKA